MASKRQPMHHALERSLAALTVGVAEGQARIERESAPMRGGNMQQAVQIPVKGRAWRTPIWTDKDVYFPYPFFQNVDPSVNDGSLVNPHYGGVGVELSSDVHIMIDAQVRGWIEDDDTGAIIGAHMRLNAWAPTATKKHPYNATLHLTFTGWAAPDDDESE